MDFLQAFPRLGIDVDQFASKVGGLHASADFAGPEKPLAKPERAAK